MTQTISFPRGENPWDIVCTMHDADGALLPDGTTAELRLGRPGVAPTAVDGEVAAGVASFRVALADQPAVGVWQFEVWATLPAADTSRQAWGQLTVQPSLAD